MKQILNKYLVYFLMFCAIFAPPFFSFNIMYILCLFMGIKVLRECKGEILIKKRNNFYIYILISIYILFVVFLNEIREPNIYLNNRMEFLYQFFILIPCQFLMSDFFWLKVKKMENQYIKMKHFVFMACNIEGILVVLSYFFPVVRQCFLNIMLKNSGNTRYADMDFISYRAYGFADTLLDTFGYGMGLVVGLCILSKKINKLEIITIILCTFSVILNSRTGLAIILISVVMKLFSIVYGKKLKINVKTILYLSILILVVYVFISSGYISDLTLSWIMGGFESILDFVFRRNSNYTLGSMKNSMFTKDFWTLPNEFLAKLFGTGHSCFGTYKINGIASDVGYVNYIWVIGILGTCVLMFFIAFLFINKIKNTCCRSEKIDLLFLMISFYFMFIKGNIITYSAGTFITILFFMRKENSNVFN